jgi:tRNA (guanine-N(7)-)-methyltransferase subunit TRM82
MPKRICAVVLDSGEKTIIVGDKFGDVYSLPLHPSAEYVPQRPSIAFKPSATELTVHTKGNLEALKQQQEQKKINPRKQGPDFEHKLLLGHVSLLTDVAIAKLQVHGKRREFILTADRDEHVRISRFPQAHIIEGYCLGHREFVSKIVIPSWTPGFMVTGGGEPSLKVYDWQKGDIICEEVFDGPVGPVIQEVLDSNKGERSLDRLAVSGIWLVKVKMSGLEGAGATHEGLILVALEG